MSHANALNLDEPKILSFDKGLNCWEGHYLLPDHKFEPDPNSTTHDKFNPFQNDKF